MSDLETNENPAQPSGLENPPGFPTPPDEGPVIAPPVIEPFRAHSLDADGVILTTIMVTSLDFPGLRLVDASIGGRVGDSVIAFEREVDGDIVVESELVPVPVPVVAPPVPRSVTMRQARLALLGAGMLDAVNQAIAGMAGDQGQAARIEWEYSQEVQRHRGLVAAMAQILSLSEQQLDDLFITAAAL